MFDRKKIAAAAQDIADHLQLIETVKALQTGQKELAEALVVMGDRIRALKSEMRILKAETKFQALKETQTIVNAVQGHLNQRIETIAVRIAIIDSRNTGSTPGLPLVTVPDTSNPTE